MLSFYQPLSRSTNLKPLSFTGEEAIEQLAGSSRRGLVEPGDGSRRRCGAGRRGPELLGAGLSSSARAISPKLRRSSSPSCIARAFEYCLFFVLPPLASTVTTNVTSSPRLCAPAEESQHHVNQNNKPHQQQKRTKPQVIASRLYIHDPTRSAAPVQLQHCAAMAFLYAQWGAQAPPYATPLVYYHIFLAGPWHQACVVLMI